jgi:REP element-mobilizing transposase RayT
MPRPNRIFVEGGWYHVYNRLSRGEIVFDQDAEASVFCDTLRDVVRRDGLTVFAWCLMPTHFHMAARTGVVPLHRPMQSVQQRVSRSVNFRRGVSGPLWQGRYRAKLVNEQRYLDQLLIYIHLNPVHAGLVDDPAGYRWSGHREILGQVKNAIVDVDEVLRVFGGMRRSARAAYVRRLKGSLDQEWVGEEPGQLPWWRLGRPPKSEDEDPESAIREREKQQEQGPGWRPSFEVDEFVRRGASLIGVEASDLRSRRRTSEVVRARELLMIAGVERYGLKVKELAQEMKKSPDGMTQTIARAARKRLEDCEFLRDLNELDLALARVDG